MKATIYTDSEFMGNIMKHEAKELIEHGTKKYAQYNKAPFVKWIPLGKRKPVGITKSGSSPMLLILEGVGHPNPESMWGEGKKVGDATVTEVKYASFDDRWEKDFDTMIDKYIAESGAKVIADYRHTKGFNSH